MDRTELELKLRRYRADQARAEYLHQYIPLMEKRLALMDCLLASLSPESRFLLTGRYIDRLTWPAIAARYQQQFRIDYTPLTLRRRTAAAVKGVCGTAG